MPEHLDNIATVCSLCESSIIDYSVQRNCNLTQIGGLGTDTGPRVSFCAQYGTYRVVHSRSKIYRIIGLASALSVGLHLALGVEHSVALLYAHLAIKIIKLSQSRLTGPMSVVQLIARATVSPPPRDPVGRTKSLKLSCCCRRRVLFR